MTEWVGNGISLRPSQVSGFALLVTLWALALTSTLLLHLAYQVRIESRLARWHLDQTLSHWAVRGAANLAMARVAMHAEEDYNSPKADWWVGAAYREVRLGTAIVSFRRPGLKDKSDYGLDDEESRLNINAASAEQLMGFPGISNVLAEAIVRYRQTLKERQDAAIKDARDALTSWADKPVPGKHDLLDGPIHSLRELLAVNGVSEATLFQPADKRPPLADLLTTVSTGKVNVNSASEAVLLAAGLTEGQVNSVVAARNKKPISSLDELKLTIGSATDPQLWERVEKIVTVRSTTFRIAVEARLPHTTNSYHLESTFQAQAEARGFLRWREFAHEATDGR